jgi:hypothetical protein
MARPSNPLLAKKKDPEKMRKYLEAANEFWIEAVQLQANRCEKAHEGPRGFVADVAFYVVAVQRLREVARMASTTLDLTDAQKALDNFDQRWPNFKHLRNILEHILLSESNPEAGHFGISFMPGSIVDLRPGGEVDYLIDVRDAAPSVKVLNQSLAEALKPAT